MINGVTNAPAVSGFYDQQQLDNHPANKTKQIQKAEQRDSAVLSPQAQQAVRAVQKTPER